MSDIFKKPKKKVDLLSRRENKSQPFLRQKKYYYSFFIEKKNVGQFSLSMSLREKKCQLFFIEIKNVFLNEKNEV